MTLQRITNWHLNPDIGCGLHFNQTRKKPKTAQLCCTFMSTQLTHVLQRPHPPILQLSALFRHHFVFLGTHTNKMVNRASVFTDLLTVQMVLQYLHRVSNIFETGPSGNTMKAVLVTRSEQLTAVTVYINGVSLKLGLCASAHVNRTKWVLCVKE